MTRSLVPAHMLTLQEVARMQNESTPANSQLFARLDAFLGFNKLGGAVRTTEDKLGDVLARSLEELSSFCELTHDPFEPIPLESVESQSTAAQSSLRDVFPGPTGYQPSKDCEYPDISFSLQDPLLW